MRILDEKKIIAKLERKEAILIRNVMKRPLYNKEHEDVNETRYQIWHGLDELLCKMLLDEIEKYKLG
jgi:hypothetical protein